MDDVRGCVAHCKTSYPTADIFQIHAFSQDWPDLALGFRRRVVAPELTANTVVLGAKGNVEGFVYVHGRLAYIVRKPNDLFWRHVRHHRMLGQNAYTGQYET